MSKLSGDAGFAYTLQWVQDGCRAELEETPAVLERAGLDGLVVDQIHQGVSAVAMATGVPFVHVACTPLIDVTGVTPLWLFPWPHEDSEAARQRNRMGVDGFLKMANGLAALIVEYLDGYGIQVDRSDLYWRTSKLAYLTQMPAVLDFPADHLPAHFHRTGPFHDGAGREPVAFPWERLTGAPLIYASMGTLQTGQVDTFRAILAATERPGYQVVLSAGVNAAPESLVLGQRNTIVMQRPASSSC